MPEGLLTYVRLTPPQAKFLQGIAERAGEIGFNWEVARPDVAAMVGELVQKGLLSDLRAERRLRLTDQGRSAVSQIEYALRTQTRVIST